MNARVKIFVLSVLSAFPLAAVPLRLPSFYGSDMVLPCETAFGITGEAAPNEEVTVKIGAQPDRRVCADAQGRWHLPVPATPPSLKPLDLTVRTSHETLVCTNVLFGDLWLCAGQSNMAFPLASCDSAAAATAAATDPHLLLLNVACRLPTDGKPWSEELLALSTSSDAFHSSWCQITPRTAPSLSGVGVMFGQALRRARRNVPLGLIQLAVGGAPVEAFTPVSDSQSRVWLDDPAFPAPWCQARAKVNLGRALGHPDFASFRHPYEPGRLYVQAVAPLTALPVKGVLWYQGESNATLCGNPDDVQTADVMRMGIASLVASWRRAWHNDALPFIMIQLPRMSRPWMLFREQQMLAAQTLPNVGLVVTTDTGTPANVHPADKAPVAERAAGEALRVAYRVPGAPAFAFGISAEGASPVLVRFKPDQKLVVKGETLIGFELSSNGTDFVPAQAALAPNNAVALRAAGIASATNVRYNWAPVPQGNLFNAAGLPVAPFRLKTTQHP